jgi:hypothetical protein
MLGVYSLHWDLSRSLNQVNGVEIYSQLNSQSPIRLSQFYRLISDSRDCRTNDFDDETFEYPI